MVFINTYLFACSGILVFFYFIGAVEKFYVFRLPFFVLALSHQTSKNLFFVRTEPWFHVEQTICFVCFGVLACLPAVCADAWALF